MEFLCLRRPFDSVDKEYAFCSLERTLVVEACRVEMINFEEAAEHKKAFDMQNLKPLLQSQAVKAL